MAAAVLAPGARVVIRDAEWIVRRVGQASDGGQQLACDGISELVHEREAVFLTSLEGDIQLLDPAKTELVTDPSPAFAHSLLNTIRTARSRTSGEYPVCLLMAPSSQGLEPPGIPRRFRGSCGNGGALNFHWKSILLSTPLAEYVVVHELVHLQEAHHTPRFWALLGCALADFERRSAELLRKGAILDCL